MVHIFGELKTKILLLYNIYFIIKQKITNIATKHHFGFTRSIIWQQFVHNTIL